MLKKGDILEAKLTKLSYTGMAICKETGVVLFIPRGIPGDTAKITIKQVKKKYGSAEILNIIKASDARVNPNCLAFNSGCGGCQWLNLNYKDQLYWKTRIAKETLQHIGKIDFKVNPIIPMENQYHYRNKLSVHYEKGKLGLNKENSHEIIPFDVCRQELPSNQKVYEVLKSIHLPNSITQAHIRSNEKGEVGIYFFATKKDNSLDKVVHTLQRRIPELVGVGISLYQKYIQLIGNSYITQKIGIITYNIPMFGFFQTNYTMAYEMQKIVRAYAALNSKDTVIDLYCGVGFFALDLAKKAKFVYGIENNSLAIAAAKENAKLNKINNTKFTTGNVESSLHTYKTGSITTIILDPPRTGCDKKVLEEIIRINPKKIIYVSCAPDTLARDLNKLSNSGYKVIKCQPLDMFPQTYHIEMVVKLVKDQ